MVSGVRVNVRVAHVGPRADDEGCAELGDARAALSDAVPVATGLKRAFDTARVEQQGGEVHLPDRRGSCRGSGVVDEDRERDLLIGDEGLRIADVARADGHHLSAGARDVLVGAPQLRGMLSAEQSAEMAQEDQDHRALRPELTEPVPSTVGAGQLNLFQALEIHLDTMPHRLVARGGA